MAPSLHFFFIIYLVQACCTIRAATLPKFSSIFLFGDSLLDTGNNNYVATVARANHYPYGRDFPGGIPTGRFTDGKMMSDFIASGLGIKEMVPPFLDPSLTVSDLRTGVCFASAGSGYDDITTTVSRVIPVSRQVGMLQDYIHRLVGSFGEKEAKSIVNGSLMVVSSASNDVSINFYAGYSRRGQFTIGAYHDFLQNKMENFVKEIYVLGVRNMLIFGLPPLGCWPSNIALGPCLEFINSDCASYNEKLVNRLPQIQASLPGAKLVYGDIYTPIREMKSNPLQYGFLVTNRPCCGIGMGEVGPTCNAATLTCLVPSHYMFWDALHPGEVAYKHVSNFLLDNIIPKFS